MNAPVATLDDVPLAPVGRPAGIAAGARAYRAVNLALALGLVLVLGLAHRAQVVGQGVVLLGWRLPETCASKAIWGRPCLGCGLTRSTILALQGDFNQSRAVHPGGVWMAGYLLGQAAARIALLAGRAARAPVVAADVTLSVLLLLAVLCLPIVFR